jgi:hypothetical protein
MLAAWRRGVDGLAALVSAEEGARALLAERYFEGHPLLFTDAETAWAELSAFVDRLTGVAGTMDPPPGEPAADGDPAVRAAARAAILADDARVRSFELLGEHERAVSIMERRLRGSDPAAQAARQDSTV